MISLLALRNRGLLVDLAESNTLVVLDYDGTLAPITADRARAFMRDETQARLEQLCERYPCAVLSGRARQDVAGRLGAAAVRYVLGAHGADEGRPTVPAQSALDRARVLLSALVRPGVELEDKVLCLSVHYRGAPNKRAAREAIQATLLPLSDELRLVLGKAVVDVLPANAPTKGDALRALVAEAGPELVLYVGDDKTDEDAFSAALGRRYLSVRVGRNRSSAARYFLHSQRDIDNLLTFLVRLRPPLPAPR